jgi:hypothetical protein
VSWFGNGVAVCGRGALVLYNVLPANAERAGQATYVSSRCHVRPAIYQPPIASLGLWGLWSCSMLPVEAAPSSDAVHPRYLCTLCTGGLRTDALHCTPLELGNCVVYKFR